MTKGEGYLALGGVLLTGILFRDGFNLSPMQSAEKPSALAKPLSVESDKQPAGEGPWLASCRYWTAIDPGGETEKAQKQPDLTLNETDTSLIASTPASLRDADTNCQGTGNRWGIPNSVATTKAQIHVIIATVPDPIHTHLSLDFDRAIDALMQAASDYHYLGSYYWLPWRRPSLPVTVDRTSSTDQTADLKAQEEPGLIIMKYNPTPSEKNLDTAGYYKVIYLFLVGESPALGANTKQLRNAMKYEDKLLEDYGATLSMQNATDPNVLTFIGPRFSGSAASVRQGLLAGWGEFKKRPIKMFGAGTTSTEISQVELNSPAAPEIKYLSFGENIKFEEDRIVASFAQAGGDIEKTAILAEDNTVLGAASIRGDELAAYIQKYAKPPDQTQVARPQNIKRPNGSLYIHFPRDISLLRNAENEPSSPIPTQGSSPYLNLSLKDPGLDDTVPKFSTNQTPLSQEAVLMAIERQLQKADIQHILIAASNILDEIFLARELERTCPNASIVFYNGGDLLIERDVDNVPFIGSVTVSPNSLTSFYSPTGESRRFFPDSQSAAVYNAASFIFGWNSTAWKQENLHRLAGALSDTSDNFRSPLIASAAGTDGYYPLGILSPCASDSAKILPITRAPASNDLDQTKYDLKPCASPQPGSTINLPMPDLPSTTPSMFWYLLCAAVIALCLAHASIIHAANYWSPFTRDLAIQQNDQPRRRAVYLHIGTSMLASMTIVLAVPWFAFGTYDRWNWPTFLTAMLTAIAGLVAVIATVHKTRSYLQPPRDASKYDQTHLYPWFNLMAAVFPVVILGLMLWICLKDPAAWGRSYANLFFSYRCLHPVSGVSPTVPLLLLLFAWYLWALFQTARLRFSSMNRPRLPSYIRLRDPKYPYLLFTSDESLEGCDPPLSNCLVKNIDCVLITKELLRRFAHWPDRRLNFVLFTIYLIAFFGCIVALKIQSMEKFLYPGHFLTAFELLVAILFYPLIMIALTGWLRVLVIWSSLKVGLLEQLDRSPFRNAFSRLSEANWITMLAQSGLSIRWRDMSRATESLRQLMNNADIERAAGDSWQEMNVTYSDLTGQIADLQQYLRHLDVRPADRVDLEKFDLPHEGTCRDLCFIYSIERRLAVMCRELIEHILMPYWLKERVAFVSEPRTEGPDTKSIQDAPQDPLYIRLVEEFLAIRYVALIRTVLVNIRHLMVFVSAAFVLSIVAWNIYPFQPSQTVDWCFTILMFCLSAGFIKVFAEMHRNPVLSRITATTPNKLGIDFYVRLVTFGAIPVLTWLAYQVPEIGGRILRLLQPSLQVIK